MSVKSYIKEKLKPFYYKYLGRPKSFNTFPNGAILVNCCADDITLLTATSNNVLKVEIEGRTIYFRQCRIHTEIHEYVRTLIEEYYCSCKLEYDRVIVEKSLANKKNFAKFVNMGVVNNYSSAVYKFCMGGSSELIGIVTDDIDLNDRLRDFAQFVWGELYSYKLNSGIKIGSYQTYNAVRQIATKRIANIFGLSELIPTTEFAVLAVSDGRKLFGTIMEKAPGTILEREPTEKRRNVVTPKLQHTLNNLNFLDTLCREKDHRPGNYTVIFNGDKASSVCAFDNDSPMSFGIGGASFKTYFNCSPYILHNSLNRPYIDKNLAALLFSTNFEMIYQETKDLLNKFQMIALKRRLKAMQKGISNIDSHRLISDKEWNDTTIYEEMNNTYGKTYLTLFAGDLKLSYQPWIRLTEY